ncbi:MAG: hypothetical protein GF364_16735 [Candidatus Lokiarchaeota archaeon]|nr:hypothetical protein [Candidatus Lokiarchaeota archaeon]
MEFCSLYSSDDFYPEEIAEKFIIADIDSCGIPEFIYLKKASLKEKRIGYIKFGERVQEETIYASRPISINKITSLRNDENGSNDLIVIYSNGIIARCILSPERNRLIELEHWKINVGNTQCKCKEIAGKNFFIFYDSQKFSIYEYATGTLKELYDSSNYNLQLPSARITDCDLIFFPSIITKFYMIVNLASMNPQDSGLLLLIIDKEEKHELSRFFLQGLEYRFNNIVSLPLNEEEVILYGRGHTGFKIFKISNKGIEPFKDSSIDYPIIFEDPSLLPDKNILYSMGITYSNELLLFSHHLQEDGSSNQITVSNFSSDIELENKSLYVKKLKNLDVTLVFAVIKRKNKDLENMDPRYALFVSALLPENWGPAIFSKLKTIYANKMEYSLINASSNNLVAEEKIMQIFKKMNVILNSAKLAQLIEKKIGSSVSNEESRARKEILEDLEEFYNSYWEKAQRIQIKESRKDRIIPLQPDQIDHKIFVEETNFPNIGSRGYFIITNKSKTDLYSLRLEIAHEQIDFIFSETHFNDTILGVDLANNHINLAPRIKAGESLEISFGYKIKGVTNVKVPYELLYKSRPTHPDFDVLTGYVEFNSQEIFDIQKHFVLEKTFDFIEEGTVFDFHLIIKPLIPVEITKIEDGQGKLVNQILKEPSTFEKGYNTSELLEIHYKFEPLATGKGFLGPFTIKTNYGSYVVKPIPIEIVKKLPKISSTLISQISQAVEVGEQIELRVALTNNNRVKAFNITPLLRISNNLSIVDPTGPYTKLETGWYQLSSRAVTDQETSIWYDTISLIVEKLGEGRGEIELYYQWKNSPDSERWIAYRGNNPHTLEFPIELHEPNIITDIVGGIHRSDEEIILLSSINQQKELIFTLEFRNIGNGIAKEVKYSIETPEEFRGVISFDYPNDYVAFDKQPMNPSKHLIRPITLSLRKAPTEIPLELKLTYEPYDLSILQNREKKHYEKKWKLLVLPFKLDPSKAYHKKLDLGYILFQFLLKQRKEFSHKEDQNRVFIPQDLVTEFHNEFGWSKDTTYDLLKNFNEKSKIKELMLHLSAHNKTCFFKEAISKAIALSIKLKRQPIREISSRIDVDISEILFEQVYTELEKTLSEISRQIDLRHSKIIDDDRGSVFREKRVIELKQEKSKQIIVKSSSPPLEDSKRGIEIILESIDIGLKVKQLIKKATQTIDIMVFIIHNVREVQTEKDHIQIGLLELLGEAATQRDVKVRIMTTEPGEKNDYHRTFIQLVADIPNISVKFCRNIHTKMMIVDKKSVLFGSANFTTTGLSGKNDYMEYIENKNEIYQYVDLFNERWEQKAAACRECTNRVCEKKVT